MNPLRWKNLVRRLMGPPWYYPAELIDVDVVWHMDPEDLQEMGKAIMVKDGQEMPRPVSTASQVHHYLKHGWRFKTQAEVQEEADAQVGGYVDHRLPVGRLYFPTWRAYLMHLRRRGLPTQYQAPDDVVATAAEYPFFCYLCNQGLKTMRLVQSHITLMRRTASVKNHPVRLEDFSKGFIPADPEASKEEDQELMKVVIEERVMARLGERMPYQDIADLYGLTKGQVDRIQRKRRDAEKKRQEEIAQLKETANV